MWKVLALLPCLILLAVEVKGDCEQLLACKDEVEESSLLDEANLVAYSDEEQALNAVCGELQNLVSCINENLDSCNNNATLNDVKAARDVVIYVCSPEGRQDVLALADSPCNDNPNLEVHADIMLLGCLEDFQFEIQIAQLEAMFEGRQFLPSDACPFIPGLGTCLVNGSTDLCGPAFGSFVSNIWNINAHHQFSEFGCHLDARRKRRALKQAMPLVLKGASLVRKLRK